MTAPGDGDTGCEGGGCDDNKLIVSILTLPAEEQSESSQPKKKQTVSIATPPHTSSDASKKSRLVLFWC